MTYIQSVLQLSIFETILVLDIITDHRNNANGPNIERDNMSYRRANQENDKAYILALLDHKNRYYNIRCEHDPKGKDSLGFFLAHSKRAITAEKKGGSVLKHHFNVNKYLVDNIDTIEQIVLATVDCDITSGDNRSNSKKQTKQWRMELGKHYKNLGYKNMNTYGEEATSLKVA